MNQCTTCTGSVYYLYWINLLYALDQCTSCLDLCNTCTWSVYYMYLIGVLYVLDQCTTCTGSVYYMYWISVLPVLDQCTIFTGYYTFCTGSLNDIYSVKRTIMSNVKQQTCSKHVPILYKQDHSVLFFKLCIGDTTPQI